MQLSTFSPAIDPAAEYPVGECCIADLSRRSLPELRHELQRCQARLGTLAEINGDLEYVRQLAHEINNRIQTDSLRAELLAMESTLRVSTPTLASCPIPRRGGSPRSLLHELAAQWRGVYS